LQKNFDNKNNDNMMTYLTTINQKEKKVAMTALDVVRVGE